MMTAGEMQQVQEVVQGESSKFWELSAMTFSLLQMIFYLYMMYQYQKKLRKYAEKLDDWASDDERVYKEFRELDTEFYDYYMKLPEYDVCDASVNRNKGASFNAYGETLRSSNRVIRGYTPLKRVHVNNMVANQQHTISSTSLARANVLIMERRRRDVHTIERWSAIVGAPVGVESYSTGAMSQVISESFKSLQTFGQGFNSAGSAFGTQLYKVL